VQLQAQAYEALTAMAEVAEDLPELGLDAEDLRAEAMRLRQTVLQAFPFEDERGVFLAAAVENAAGNLRTVDSRTVNAGFVLSSGLLDGHTHRGLREAVLRHLFSPAMSSAFGIVGRARDEVRFEVFDYHSQVWGFAVHRVARGLERSGYTLLARELDARVMRQTRHGLLPENVGGGPGPNLEYCPHVLRVSRRAADGRPIITVKERPPAPYAAWTAAAVIAIDSRARTAAADDAAAGDFEAEVLASLPSHHRAYRHARDLTWIPGR